MVSEHQATLPELPRFLRCARSSASKNSAKLTRVTPQRAEDTFKKCSVKLQQQMTQFTPPTKLNSLPGRALSFSDGTDLLLCLCLLFCDLLCVEVVIAGKAVGVMQETVLLLQITRQTLLTDSYTVVLVMYCMETLIYTVALVMYCMETLMTASKAVTCILTNILLMQMTQGLARFSGASGLMIKCCHPMHMCLSCCVAVDTLSTPRAAMILQSDLISEALLACRAVKVGLLPNWAWWLHDKAAEVALAPMAAGLLPNLGEHTVRVALQAMAAGLLPKWT